MNGPADFYRVTPRALESLRWLGFSVCTECGLEVELGDKVEKAGRGSIGQTRVRHLNCTTIVFLQVPAEGNRN